VVFGAGLFWRQITPNAALWTAIATIPAGILFKVVSPTMPFQLRMGYVFIILCLIASVISFLERGHKVPSPQPAPARQKYLVMVAYFFFILAGLTALLTTLLLSEYLYLGIESAYMLAVLFAMLGIILYTNAKMQVADKKALESDPVLYNTATPFNIGAAGVVLIITLLYYFFWM
jgi:solute:Na+ symporter, SSS family